VTAKTPHSRAPHLGTPKAQPQHFADGPTVNLGDAVELLADDLALDVAGAEQIFAAAQVSLTRELVTAVTERTEGWPVGIYLAAVIAHDSNNEDLTVSGDDRYVADYLYRESLMQLPASLRRQKWFVCFQMPVSWKPNNISMVWTDGIF
jgi:ATP/maltotriose-dependent transcriptional regulator MalT